MSAAQVRLRPATQADAETITEILLTSRRRAMPYLRQLYTDAQARTWIEGHVLVECDVTVALLAERVVGFIAVRAGFLDHLYVTPDAQSRGVGSRLLAAAKAARPDGLRLYVFQRNTNACGFYEKHGFTLVALDDGTRNEEGEPDALYEWHGGLRHLHRRGR